MSKIKFSEEELAILKQYTNSEDVVDILNQFGGDIDKLKAYVKWLYKYGGTGSKGNGGGGGSSSSSWSIICTLDGQLVTSNSKPILLNKTDNNTYQLRLSIGRPGDSSYSIEVQQNKIKIGTKTISAENNEYIINTRIVANGNFLIKITNNDTDEPKLISFNYIISAHELTYSLVDNSDKDLGMSNTTLYLKNITNGLKLKLTHNIYVEAQNVKINTYMTGLADYTINDIILSNTGINTETNNAYSYIDLFQIIGLGNVTEENINDIVGTYNISGKLSYTYDGNPVTEEFTFIFTLIPEGLYLKVTPRLQDAIIYRTQKDKNSELTYKFNSKNIVFNITAYDNVSSSLTLRIQKKDNNKYIDLIAATTIYRQQNHQFTIQLTNSLTEITEHELKFVISNSRDINEYIYYVYLDTDTAELNWYDRYLNILKEHAFIGNNIINTDEENINLESLKQLNRNFSGTGYIQMNTITDENGINIFHENSNAFTTENSDLLISIGLQYNEVNNHNSNLMKLSFDLGETTPSILLQQNSLIFGTEKVEIFIPKETSFDISNGSKYHILNILIRNTEKSENEKYAYEFIVYLDGYIEGALTSYFTTQNTIRLTDITVYESNYGINLLDIAYIANNSSQTSYSQITDVDIVQYYYKYNKNFNHPDYPLVTNTEINYFKQVKDLSVYFEDVDFYNNLNQITTSVIKIKQYNKDADLINFLTQSNNIPIIHNIPFLILNMNIKNNNQFTTDKEFFENFLNRNVSQNEFDKLIGIDIPSFTIINDDGTYNTYNRNVSNFRLQGSSTGKYKSKNFTLTIAPPAEAMNENKVALFTPNFKTDDPMTFLPEAMFTFKADAVDSTHANNTSAGLFINKNTTAFTDSREVHENVERYKPYIKNCLTGFPIITIFGLTNTDSEGNDVTTYYYMGIYNCNLGRDSYLNLGYYPVGNILNNLTDIDGNPINLFDTDEQNKPLHNGFGVYLVDNERYQPIDDLSIAEIQGGNTYFDFSQFGETILFEDSDHNEGMFGDFYPKNADLRLSKQKIRTFVREVATVGGLIFSKLEKNMSTSPEDNYGYDEGYSSYYIDENGKHHDTESTNFVPNYKYQFDRFQSNFYLNEDATNLYQQQLHDNITGGDIDWKPIFSGLIGITTNSEGNVDPIEYHHTDELFSKWFYLLDYTSLVEYYTICMAFGLVDSVCKNLNIKSFRESGPFYIAFYDMDTSFGRNNLGGYVSPFAFSDYWKNATDRFGNNSNVIYRDFYPDKDIIGKISVNDRYENINVPDGYDIPSSYLFAIAKYAKILYTVNNYDRYKTNPNYFWYQLRGNSSSELRNAKYFINNYFGKNLNNISRIFFNANYRYKYLQKTSEGFDQLNLVPFHGRGLYSLEDWLNKRFHILDAYFNITEIRSNNNIQKYNLTTKQWEDVYDNGILLYDPSFSSVVGDTIASASNTDIYLLRSIFASSDISSDGTWGGNSIGTIYMRTLDYSPMLFKHQTDFSQFICIDSNKLYNWKQPSGKGEITCKFGGSIGWTHVETFNTLIPSNKQLTLNAPYLEDIIITQGNLTNLSLQSIPSVRIIQINSENVSCTINLSNSQNEDKYPNLRTIDLHNSHCNLIVNNLNVTHINVSGIVGDPENSDMSINNCPNLKSCNLNNTSLNSLTLTSMWSDNIVIDNTRIKRMTISNTQFDHAKIKIMNDTALTNLTLSGFESIEINNCPNLLNIIIAEDTSSETQYYIKSLKIINCCNYIRENKSNLNFTFNGRSSSKTSNNDIILDLSLLKNLEELSVNSTEYIDSVILPDKEEVTLLPYCFANTNLSTIRFNEETSNSGNHYLCIVDNRSSLPANVTDVSCHTFYNSKFNYDANTVNYRFKIPNENTSLISMFEIGNSSTEAHSGFSALTYSDVYDILTNPQTCIVNPENIISMEKMFARQASINYSYTSQQTYTSNDRLVENFVSLSNYSNLQNCKNIFWNTQITVFDNNLFNGTFNHELNILNIFGRHLFYIHEDCIKNIKNQITGFLYDITGNDDDNVPYISYNNILLAYNNLGVLNEVNVHNLLYSDDENAQTYITKLCGLNFVNLITNINNLFTEKQSNVDTIINCFNNLCQYDRNKYNCPSRASFSKGFNNIGLTNIADNLLLDNAFIGITIDIKNMSLYNALDINELVDITKFVDMNRQYQKVIQNYLARYSVINNLFNFYKSCDYNIDESAQANWTSFWYNLYLSRSENLKYLFNRTVFKFKSDSDEDTLITIPQPTIGHINNINTVDYLFSECTGVYLENNIYKECGIRISNNTLSPFNKLVSLLYIFSGTTFNGKYSYPLPENLLEGFTNLTSISHMFDSSKIIGNNKTYKNSNYKRQIYKKSTIFSITESGIDIKNYDYSPDSISTENTIIYGYPIIPVNFFKYNTPLTNISYLFINSDFEGYIPESLFTDLSASLTNLNYIFNNCKILPQLITSFTNQQKNDKISNLSQNSSYNIYSLFPKNFLNITGKINALDIFGIYVTVSSSPNDRIYLFNDLTFTGDNTNVIINNFNVNFHPDSLIISKYVIQNDVSYKILVNEQLETPELSLYFNICFNFNEAENTTNGYLQYSEGLKYNTTDVITFRQLSNNGYLLNMEMSEIYYGYLLEKGTVLGTNNYFTGELNPRYLVNFNREIINPLQSSQKDTIPCSKNIIYPSILYLHTITTESYPTTFVGKRFSTITNINKYKYLYTIKGHVNIYLNYIDTLIPDVLEENINENTYEDYIQLYNISISYEEDPDNVGYINNYINIGNYYTYLYYNTSEFSTLNDVDKSQVIKNALLEYTYMIYYNYLLLFNSWEVSNPARPQEGSSITSSTIYIYNNLDILNEDTTKVLVKANSTNDILYNTYTCQLQYEEGTTVYKIIGITANS